MKAQQKQKFSRYEFKYIIPNDLSSRIEEEIEHFMDYDGFIHPSLGNRYLVRSLYFDNDQSTNFYDKVDGIKKRSKYRIRTYGDIQDSSLPFFLEEKGRIESRTYKERIHINFEDINLLTGNWANLENIEKYDSIFMEKFLYNRLRKRLVPKVLVDYYRKPYINKFGLYFRLTFDSNLKCQKTTNIFPLESETSQFSCLPGSTILELKFDRSIPPWFHRIIQSYQLKRVSVSKFVLGMTRLKIAEDI